MRKLFKLLFSRIFIIAFLILIQLFLFVFLLEFAAERFSSIFNVLTALNTIFIIYLFSIEKKEEYKMLWAVIAMLLPPIGFIFYFLFSKLSINPKVKNTFGEIYKNTTTKLISKNTHTIENLKSENPSLGKMSNFLHTMAKSPLYDNCECTYFPLGEKKFVALVNELKKAQTFICMEYFIVEKGLMLNTILDILEEKAKKGVEIFFMYDDMGSISKVPKNFDKELIKKGIMATKFNKVKANLSTFINYRDHRKIAVIDGKVGFVGGINLADEYINKKVIFGHWKDTAVMLKGEAVFSLTTMFFQLYSFSKGVNYDINKYKALTDNQGEGYVQPFGDDPLDNIDTSENNYINIINSAKDYLYITTPYLIIDSTIMTALKIAAQSGVDIRIITPGIPDKKTVFYITRSNYKPLIEAGVKIFEYTPGFIHAKMFVSDDQIATVGTINLDYRSLYLHFECACSFYKNKIVMDVKNDIEETLTKCRQISLQDLDKTPLSHRLIQFFLRVFSPLL